MLCLASLQKLITKVVQAETNIKIYSSSIYIGTMLDYLPRLHKVSFFKGFSCMRSLAYLLMLIKFSYAGMNSV